MSVITGCEKMFNFNDIYNSTNLIMAAKRALREKDKGILMDGQKKRKLTKTKTISKGRKNRLDVCKYSKMRLGVRYSERENNGIVTVESIKVCSVIAGVRNSGSLVHSNVCTFRRGFSCCP